MMTDASDKSVLCFGLLSTVDLDPRESQDFLSDLVLNAIFESPYEVPDSDQEPRPLTCRRRRCAARSTLRSAVASLLGGRPRRSSILRRDARCGRSTSSTRCPAPGRFASTRPRSLRRRARGLRAGAAERPLRSLPDPALLRRRPRPRPGAARHRPLHAGCRFGSRGGAAGAQSPPPPGAGDRRDSSSASIPPTRTAVRPDCWTLCAAARSISPTSCRARTLREIQGPAVTWFEPGNSDRHPLLQQRKRPFLADPRVRKALAMAIDRSRAGSGSSTPTRSPSPPPAWCPPPWASWRDRIVTRTWKQAPKRLLADRGVELIPAPSSMHVIWSPRPYLPQPRAAAEHIAARWKSARPRRQDRDGQRPRTITSSGSVPAPTRSPSRAGSRTPPTPPISSTPPCTRGCIPMPGESVAIRDNLSRWRHDEMDAGARTGSARTPAANEKSGDPPPAQRGSAALSPLLRLDRRQIHHAGQELPAVAPRAAVVRGDEDRVLSTPAERQQGAQRHSGCQQRQPAKRPRRHDESGGESRDPAADPGR